MTNLIDDIHSRCLNLSAADRKVLAKMLGSFASDSPVLSYLPWAAAVALQSLLDRSATEFDAVTDPVPMRHCLWSSVVFWIGCLVVLHLVKPCWVSTHRLPRSL